MWEEDVVRWTPPLDGYQYPIVRLEDTSYVALLPKEMTCRRYIEGQVWYYNRTGVTPVSAHLYEAEVWEYLDKALRVGE